MTDKVPELLLAFNDVLHVIWAADVTSADSKLPRMSVYHFSIDTRG